MTDSVNIFFINPAIDLLQYFSVSTSLKVLKSITSFKRSSSSSIDAAILKIPSAKQIYRLFFIVSIRIDKIRGTFLLSSIVYSLNCLFKQSNGCGFLEPWIDDLTTFGVGVWIFIPFVISLGHFTKMLNIFNSEIYWISSTF